MGVIRKFRYIFSHKQKVETVIIVIMIMIGTVLELMGVSMLQPVINCIMNPEKIMRYDILNTIFTHFVITDPRKQILWLLAGVVIVYLVKNAYLIFMYRAQYKYIYSNMRQLSTKMMRSYLARSYSYHKKKSTAELLRNINQDTADFFGVIQALVFLLTEGMVVAALIIYLFIMDKSVTIAIGLILGLIVLFLYKFYKKYLLKLGQHNRECEARVNKWVQQAFGGIKEVKVMNKEDFFYRKYDDAYAGRVHSEYNYHTFVSIPKPMIEAATISALIAAAGLKIMLGTDPSYFVPTLSAFVVAAYRLLPSFNRITEHLGAIAYQRPAVNAIYEDLKEIDSIEHNTGLVNRTAKESVYEDGTKKELIKALELNNAIHIDNLSFEYEDGDKKILDNISFDINKNTSVAFIGASGAGKTTLADIILGLLPPTSGDILIDDKSLKDYMDEWHRTVAYIPQSIYILDDTIRANIAFGIPKDEIDEERIEQAIRRSQLSDVIDNLPEGLDTVLGEGGVRFSGGQRQRIGIARALYNDPKVLILDEATSALDNETEKAVMDSIDSLHGEMTLIIIAHRLSTIQGCDHIYRIEDGKAVLQK
ncbi:ABC transporter ATP-binding protein [Butyrivibrio fibrisolvens]|uniref:ABC transporter ATP-binding protein n=1 Tax=Butyrivibrio fibrisolvens TaxID=831 RepID=UPI0004031C34|nr:ABC transporter ATP-binding protein [Butyrivibrio fibrisolvens]